MRVLTYCTHSRTRGVNFYDFTSEKHVLYATYEKAKKGFLNYSSAKHALTYKGKHSDKYAEPEFSGKYIDICMKYYKDSGDERFLQNAVEVIDSIKENASKDGYLGMLRDESRWDFFSVWNQTFTVFGLLSYFKQTKDYQVLEIAERCASYIAKHYMENSEIDILDAPNYGTQHISFLLVLPELYKITKKQIYYDFMEYIVNRLKKDDLNFFNFSDILDLRSPKAIENFVILLGILEYGSLTGDKTAFEGAKRYWQQVNDTQIRNTGNGSINEVWVKNGNAPMLLDITCNPNETCVAVGWIEFSISLFYKEHDAKYLDAIEKTLFNHILGSISEDGGDFAYYQPNYGTKIYKTNGDMYKCCRYRGYTLMSYLKDMFYYADENEIIPLIYQSEKYEDESVEIKVQTDYPYLCDLKYSITLKKKCDKKFKLRIPYWCKKFEVDSEIPYIKEYKYVVFNLKDIEESADINLRLLQEVTAEKGEIEGKPYVSYTCGPLLLALDGIQNNELSDIYVCKDSALDSFSYIYNSIELKSKIIKNNKETDAIFRDYASAGRNQNEKYMVWIPVR